MHIYYINVRTDEIVRFFFFSKSLRFDGRAFQIARRRWAANPHVRKSVKKNNTL